MKIDAALNLGFPIRWSEKVDAQGALIPLVWAYHTPIGREVFEANYRAIAATQLEIAGKGSIGQRIATLALKEACKNDALEHGLEPPANPALLGEIRRLTIVLAPTDAAGYELLPIDQAIARGVIDAEDWSEAESALVFFTCALSLVRRISREPIARTYALVLRGSITSLPPLEFVASLPTSTPAETSEATPPSSVPS